MENNIFEDFIKRCYEMNNEKKDRDKSGNTEKCRCFDSDIPGGFQDISPEIFILIGDILGAIISNKIPFNVQNSFGNWLQLIGQSILTYNAQQQYFQIGPGKYYDPQNRNIYNPECQPTNASASELKKLNKKIEELEEEVRNLKRIVDKR